MLYLINVMIMCKSVNFYLFLYKYVFFVFECQFKTPLFNTRKYNQNEAKEAISMYIPVEQYPVTTRS